MNKLKNWHYIVITILAIPYLIYLYSNHTGKFEDVEYTYRGIDRLRFNISNNKKVAIIDKYQYEYDSIAYFYNHYMEEYEMFSKEYFLYNAMKLKSLEELKAKRFEQYNKVDN